MKRFLCFFATAMAGIALMSCDNGEKVANPRDRKAVTFQSSILGAPVVSRASGSSWGTDKIGVTMLPAGETDYAKAHGKNHCYTTTGDGNFVHSNSANALYYPEAKTAVDFVAYYPHKETTAAEYTIDLVDQTSPELIDLMYSNNVKNVTEGTQALVFEHKLTRVVFNITYPGGPTLAGAKVNLKDVPTLGTFHLINNAIAEKPESVGTIAARVTGDASAASAEAIVIPGARTYKLEIELANGEKVEETVTADYAGGKIYTYPVSLSAPVPAGELMAGTATITDWTDVPQATMNLITTPGAPSVGPTLFDYPVIYASLVGASIRLDQDAANLVKDGVTLVPDKGTHTGSYPQYYVSGAAVRVYTGNTLQIKATGITKVEFVHGGNAFAATCTTVGFTSPVWSSATAVDELTFSFTGSSRFTQIKVTHE